MLQVCVDHGVVLNEWYNMKFEVVKMDILGSGYGCLKYRKSHSNQTNV